MSIRHLQICKKKDSRLCKIWKEMKMPDIDQINFRLLQNGLDFIDYALDHLSGVELTNRDIKYGVLHLNSGIEIILKEKLFQTHWSLVFADINEADSNHLDNFNFQSPNLAITIKRLKKICDIKDIDYDDFEPLNKTRNKIEHFTITDNVPTIKSHAALATHRIIEFIEKHIEITEEEDKNLFVSIKEKILLFDEFIKVRMEKILEQFRPEDLFLCPSCGQKSFFIKKYQCRFCGYENDDPYDLVQKVLEMFLSDIWGDGPIVEICFNCNEPCVVNIKNEYHCYACGSKGNADNFDRCNICDSLVFIEKGLICDSCLWELVQKDD